MLCQRCGRKWSVCRLFLLLSVISLLIRLIPVWNRWRRGFKISFNASNSFRIGLITESPLYSGLAASSFLKLFSRARCRTMLENTSSLSTQSASDFKWWNKRRKISPKRRQMVVTFAVCLSKELDGITAHMCSANLGRKNCLLKCQPFGCNRNKIDRFQPLAFTCVLFTKRWRERAHCQRRAIRRISSLPSRFHHRNRRSIGSNGA